METSEATQARKKMGRPLVSSSYIMQAHKARNPFLARLWRDDYVPAGNCWPAEDTWAADKQEKGGGEGLEEARRCSEKPQIPRVFFSPHLFWIRKDLGENFPLGKEIALSPRVLRRWQGRGRCRRESRSAVSARVYFFARLVFAASVVWCSLERLFFEQEAFLP